MATLEERVGTLEEIAQGQEARLLELKAIAHDQEGRLTALEDTLKTHGLILSNIVNAVSALQIHYEALVAKGDAQDAKLDTIIRQTTQGIRSANY